MPAFLPLFQPHNTLGYLRKFDSVFREELLQNDLLAFLSEFMVRITVYGRHVDEEVLGIPKLLPSLLEYQGILRVSTTNQCQCYSADPMLRTTC